MTELLSPSTGYLILLALGGLTLIVTVVFATRVGTRSIEGFLVAERRIPWWLGGISIAASWTWAIALMVSVQMAYENGLAGSFWFIVPNVIAVLLFVWLAPHLRRRLPEGFSFPEWMFNRFGSKAVVLLYLLVFAFYQVMAVTVQIYAGSHLFSAATGISPTILMPLLLAITLVYTLISGFEASVITDLIQFVLMLVFGTVIVTMTVFSADAGLSWGGTSTNGGLNPFNPTFALTVGVVTSIGLISGAIADQQLWQRAIAFRERHVRRGFTFGAAVFAIIPISLSILGFVAANPANGVTLPNDVDPSLITFVVVDQLLPSWAAVLFLFVLLAGMSSTLDSGLTAWSALSEYVHRRPWGTSQSQRKSLGLFGARLAMCVVAAVGLALAYLVDFLPGFDLKYLWWFMNTMGTAIAVPTILSLFWRPLAARGILVGSGLSLGAGLPMVAYASINQNDVLLSATYVAILVVSTLSCLMFRDTALRSVTAPSDIK